MRARMVVILAGLVGGIGWMSKMLIMAGQGGPDPDSVPESAAFFMGLIGVVVAAVAAGAYLARSKSSGWRLLAGLAAFLTVGLIISVGQAVLPALPGDSWVQEEAIFGIVGFLAVVVAATAIVRREGAEADASSAVAGA